MSAYIIPILIAALIVYALLKKVKIFDAFVDGAKKALPLAAGVLPFLAAVFIMSKVFDKSGLNRALIDLLTPLYSFFERGRSPHFDKAVFGEREPRRFIRSFDRTRRGRLYRQARLRYLFFKRNYLLRLRSVSDQNEISRSCARDRDLSFRKLYRDDLCGVYLSDNLEFKSASGTARAFIK